MPMDLSKCCILSKIDFAILRSVWKVPIALSVMWLDRFPLVICQQSVQVCRHVNARFIRMSRIAVGRSLLDIGNKIGR